MVKRAGIDATPEGTIGAVNVESGAAGLRATADMWNQIGQTARDVRESVKPILVDRAKKKAAAAVMEGDFSKRGIGWTDESRAYNNAVEAAYLAKSQNDIDTRLGQAETEFSEDGEGFGKAVEGIRAGLLEGVDPSYAVAISGYIDNQSTQAALRVARRRQGTIVKESEIAIKSRLEVLDAQHSEMMPDDPQWGAYMQQRAAVQEALKNPIFGIPDEALEADTAYVISRAEANAIGQTALEMYEEGEDKAEAAARALAFLGDQFKRTDLTLTPAQRDAAMGEKRRAIVAAETARRSAERELRRDVVAMQSEFRAEARAGLEDLETSLKVHVLPPEAEVKALVEAIENANSPALVRQGREVLAQYAAESALKGLSYPEVAATVNAWAAQADANPDDEEKARLYKYGIKFADDANATQRRHPLEFQRDFQQEAPAPVIGEGANPDTLAARVEQAKRAAATAGGARVQYFFPAEREHYAALADNGGTEAFRAAMMIYEGAPDEATRRAMFAEIGPAGPALGYAGMMLSGGDINAARRILAGQQLLRRVGTAAADGYRPAQLKAEDRDRVWSRLTPPGMTPNQLADRRRAADLMFEGAFSEGAPEDSNAYEKAVRTISGERTINGESFGGMTRSRGLDVQAPPWIKTGQFSTILNGMTLIDWTAASATGAAPFTRAPGGRLGAADTATLNAMNLISTGAPGRYHLTRRNAPGANAAWEVLPDATGAPYVLDLNKMRTALAVRRPDAVIPEPTDGR